MTHPRFQNAVTGPTPAASHTLTTAILLGAGFAVTALLTTCAVILANPFGFSGSGLL